MTPPETKILAVDETGAQPLPDAPQGGTVLLLHSPGGRDDGWSGRAAVALSRGWRDQGRRILLCDASMEAPQLHKAAGVPNAEGISDALRFGTSLKRVARRLEANLFLATAGSVAFDAGSLRESPRWDTFTAGFAEAGALLVLFAPVDGDSVDALVRRADLVYVLASPGETISVDYLGGEPTAILTRSDRDDPALLLDKEDASVAGSMEWDESADDDSADNESPMDDQGDSEEAEDDSDAGSVGPDDQAEAAAEPIEIEIDGESIADIESEADNQEADDQGDHDEQDDAVLDIGAVAPDADDEPPVVSTEDTVSPSTSAPLKDDEIEFIGLTPDDEPVAADAPPAPADDIPEWEQPVDAVVTAAPQTPPADSEDPLRFLDPLIGDAADPAPESSVLEPGEAVNESGGAAEENSHPGARVDVPVVAPRRASESSSRSRILLIVLVVLAVVVAAAVWFGLIDIPGLPQANASESSSIAEGAASGADPALPTSDPATPDAAVAAYALALGSFSDLSLAMEQVQNWSRVAEDVQFVLAPVEVQGQAWYRLLAGPAIDSTGAAELGLSLSALASGVDSSAWLVREAGLAFLLGETRGRPAADQRVLVLQSLGIPAHILRVPYSDGTEVFRVYAGAYASESEAGFLEQMLRDQDITNAPLTERLGTLSE